MTRKISKAGEDFITQWEELRLEPYKDVKGVWTIGYGHTHGVTENSPPIDKATAELLLSADLRAAEGYVEHLIHVVLNDNQFAALVSLVYNCGTAPLLGHFGGYVNAGNMTRAAKELLIWNHSGGKVIDGLTNRRKAEQALFLKPM